MGEPRPDAVDVLRALDAHVLENTREVRGLRDDLGRIYGRDAAGRLLVAPPSPGGGPAVPKRAWTPDDVKDILGRILGGAEEPPRRRRR
jgi:hypothetical protein